VIPYVEHAQRALRNRGLRITSGRRVIIGQILAQQGHFDAEQLARGIRETGAKVSRATVYRTVSCLVEVGLLRRYDRGDGPAEYEPTLGREHHEHMICIGCGQVLEFVEDEIERLQDEVCRRHGFRPVRHTLQIHGLCAECAVETPEDRSWKPAIAGTGS
jgi:Fur family ferric uptake transcriptional regulator